MAESGEERRQTSSTAQKQCIRNQPHPCEMEHFTHRNTGTQLTNGIRCEWHGKKKKVSSCFEYKENTSVTKPQRYDFKQKKQKKTILKQLR